MTRIKVLSCGVLRDEVLLPELIGATCIAMEGAEMLGRVSLRETTPLLHLSPHTCLSTLARLQQTLAAGQDTYREDDSSAQRFRMTALSIATHSLIQLPSLVSLILRLVAPLLGATCRRMKFASVDPLEVEILDMGRGMSPDRLGGMRSAKVQPG